jgi:uncharacterized protein YbjT (DUF2867 family)
MIRAITRDASKPASQALKEKGVEVVACDTNDEGSIQKAVQGAHTVFAVTISGLNPSQILSVILTNNS